MKGNMTFCLSSSHYLPFLPLPSHGPLLHSTKSRSTFRSPHGSASACPTLVEALPAVCHSRTAYLDSPWQRTRQGGAPHVRCAAPWRPPTPSLPPGRFHSVAEQGLEVPSFPLTLSPVSMAPSACPVVRRKTRVGSWQCRVVSL